MTAAEIKEALNKPVKYKGGGDYVMTAAIFRRNSKTGEYYYQAEILDKSCGGCLLYVGLKDIEKA